MYDWWEYFRGNDEEEMRYQAFKERLQAEEEDGEFALEDRLKLADDIAEQEEEDRVFLEHDRKLYFLNKSRAKQGKKPLKKLPERYK